MKSQVVGGDASSTHQQLTGLLTCAGLKALRLAEEGETKGCTNPTGWSWPLAFLQNAIQKQPANVQGGKLVCKPQRASKVFTSLIILHVKDGTVN